MVVDALVAVRLRNNYYKEGARRILAVILVSLLTNCLLAYTLVYLIYHPPEPQYFSVGINGRITPMVSTDKPNQSNDQVLRWASQAGLAAFSYSYVNYRDELQASSGFFTGNGWGRFLDALKSSNNLLAVADKKMVVSAQMVAPAQLVSPPAVMKEGSTKGSYAWRVEVPVLVTYQNDREYTQMYNMVNILVVRVSIINAPWGIGIEQLVVSPVDNEKR